MKNVIFSNWRDFVEVSEKDGKLFSNSIFSIYPSINRMFVADDDITITTHDDDTVYNVKKGDVVFSFRIGEKTIISVSNDDIIRQYLLDRKEKHEREIAEKEASNCNLSDCSCNDCSNGVF